MILRARWTGNLPVAGEYLMAQSRAKNAYRIVDIEQLRDLPHHVPGYARLKLEVERVTPGDVPEGAVVHPWRWDARKKTGFAWSASS